MIYQSIHTLKKYAQAGTIALGLTLTANSSAWAGLFEGVAVTAGPSASSFNSEWDAAKGVVGPRSHIAGCVTQNIVFPTGSAWNLCVKAVNQFGLIISHASFQKSPASPFVTVLFDGRFGEIFTVYHPGTPRFRDISDFTFPPLTLSTGSPSASDCPSPRVLIDSNQICREIRDSGIAWKIAFNGDNRVRRGQEVVYFAVLGASNYSYIEEWSFRDDGTIASRAGSTGPKFFGPNDTEGHMHNFTWRLDVDLNGSAGDSVCLSQHIENLAPPSTATDSCTPITTEAGLDWNAFEFNTLSISDSTLVNGHGRKTTYDLVPLRTGTSRHSEAFTQHDFWVTRFNPNAAELLASGLPGYVNGQSTAGQDLVEWYTGSEHHEMDERDEKRGSTPTIWIGFELVPHNLFDGTPFF